LSSGAPDGPDPPAGGGALGALDRIVSLAVLLARPSRRLVGGLVPVALALAAAFASYWWLQRIAEPEPGAGVDERGLPDYWMDGVRRTTLDDTGAVASVLTADRLEHFPADDSSELVHPRLALYNGAVEPWIVIAEHAYASGAGDVVELNGAVDIYRRDASGAKRIEVVTSDLRILPKEQYAETERPATITAPDTVTTGIGMRVNFSVDRLELLNNVRTRHEPRKARNGTE